MINEKNGQRLFKELSKPKRVIKFIDGNNLYHAVKELYKINFLDIQEFANTLCLANRNLEQIRYYYAPFIENINRSMFIEQQKYIGQIRNFSNVKLIEGKYIKKPILLKKSIMNKIEHLIKKEDLIGYTEKGTDVNIAIDMLLLAINDRYDTAILVSGDGDFAPVIGKIKEFKKKVQVAAFDNDIRHAYALKNAASSFINLSHIIPAVLRQTKKPQSND